MKLDKNTKDAVALDGTEYIPGYIGLNNIKQTDYLNVVVQVLYNPFKQCRFHYINSCMKYFQYSLEAKFHKLWIIPNNFKVWIIFSELKSIEQISCNSNKIFMLLQNSTSNTSTKALAHVPPLRNFFMAPKNYAHVMNVFIVCINVKCRARVW